MRKDHLGMRYWAPDFPASTPKCCIHLQKEARHSEDQWHVQGHSESQLQSQHKSNWIFAQNPLALTARQWPPLPRNQPVMEGINAYLQDELRSLENKNVWMIIYRLCDIIQTAPVWSRMEMWWITSKTPELQENLCSVSLGLCEK